MTLVKVKTKYQVTLPYIVRQKVKVNIGDLMEANVEKGKITLIPKTILDRGIAESIEEYKQGKSYGPFETAEEMIASLKSNLKKLRRSKVSK